MLARLWGGVSPAQLRACTLTELRRMTELVVLEHEAKQGGPSGG